MFLAEVIGLAIALSVVAAVGLFLFGGLARIAAWAKGRAEKQMGEAEDRFSKREGGDHL